MPKNDQYSSGLIAKYYYENTNVLVNKYDIRDAGDLARVERDHTFLKMYEFFLIDDRQYGFAYFRDINKYLFSELYYWAGQIRSINIAKDGYAFCPCEVINQRSMLLFQDLLIDEYLVGMPRDDLVLRVAYYLQALNEIHPFIEGNGRTIRTFIASLLANAGYDIYFKEVGKDLLPEVDILATQGDNTLLINILDSIVSERS